MSDRDTPHVYALEEGKHAAESGMDLKAYAEAAGKARQSLQHKLYAYRVMASVPHVGHDQARDSWRTHGALEFQKRQLST